MTVLRPGSRIRSEAEGGRIGQAELFVIDSNGNLLILAAQDLVGLATQFFAELTSDFVVYRPSNPYPVEVARGSPTSLVGWLAPRAGQRVELDQAFNRPLTSTDHLFDRMISVRDKSGQLHALQVTATNQTVAFVDHTGATSTARGVVRASAPPGAVLPKGTAGAAVLTEQGELAGVVVGEAQGDVFFVSIIDVLHSEGLTLATAADAERHNEFDFSYDGLSIRTEHSPALSLIWQHLGGTGKPPESPNDVLEPWLEQALRQKLAGEDNAFAPYDQYFTASDNPDPYLQLSAFRDAELPKGDSWYDEWDEVLAGAYGSAVRAVHAPRQGPSVTRLSGSSHDLVLGEEREP